MTSQHTMYKQKHSYHQADQINFAKTNLFFIKSKHVFKNYKNHDYFEAKPNNQFRQSEYKEFVSYPTSFGINNAYKYLCDQLVNRKINRIKFNHHNLHTQGQKIFKNTAKQRFMVQKVVKPHYTLPNLAENSAKIQSGSFLQKSNKFVNKLGGQSQQRGEEMIDIIFVHKCKKLNGQEKHIHYGLKINIYNNIVSTFIKSRINYRDLSYDEFTMIKKKIIDIFNEQKENIQYKDIINIKCVKDIFKLIQQRNDPVFTKETLRYFFVSSVQIYQYQLQKIKDQLKNLVNYQFQEEISQEDINIYSVGGKQITHLQEMMSHNNHPFICGIHKNVYQIYIKQRNQNNSKRNMVKRINKWKNSITSSPKQRACHRLPTTLLNDQKYKKLFENVKRKRSGLTHNKKRSAISLRSSQFIDRDKLCKDQNIFQ